MKYLIIYFFFIGMSSTLQSQVSWDGEAGDGLWSSKKNWSKDELLIKSDEVIIHTEGNVTADIPVLVARIELSQEATLLIVADLSIINSKNDALTIQQNCRVVNEEILEIKNPQGRGIYNFEFT